MPWEIQENNPACRGFAVVKTSDGEVEGCHRSRAQAERQIAALNIAEANHEEEEERLATGPTTVITDIDGTLVDPDAGVNAALIRNLNNRDATIIVVTGRVEGQRDNTIALLDRIGLQYDSLIMSDGGNPTTYKRETAVRLLERYNIVAAYENNPETIAAYEKLGIPTEAPAFRRAIAAAILARIKTVD